MGLFFVASLPVPGEAKTKFNSPPLQLGKIRSIELPSDLRRKALSLRVKNLSNGRFVIIKKDQIGDSISVSSLSGLVDSEDEVWLPEFSVLQKQFQPVTRETLPRSLLVQKREMAPEGLGKALIEPEEKSQKDLLWKQIGYRISKESQDGKWSLRLNENVVINFLTLEQASRRREIQESSEISKLFDIGWRSLEIAKYDLSAEAFEKLIEQQNKLNLKQKAQAYLGRAVTRFNLEGCAERLQDELLEADRDSRNQDDVGYYRALCALEEENYLEAENLFKEIVAKGHAQYGETSAFYIGVIAEKQERYDQAESVYLDTIDFTSDPAIVQLAKERLSYVRYLKNKYELSDSILHGGLSVTGAWDSNVVALPLELSPADYGLSKESSAYISTLGFLSLVPPWSSKFSHQINYNFFVTHYQEPSLVAAYDSMIHDIGTSFGFSSSSTINHSLSVSFSTVRVGSWGASYESLRSHSLSYQLRNIRVDSKNHPRRFVDYSFGFSNVLLKSAVSSPDYNPGAEGVSFGVKISELESESNVYGPIMSIEYRPARGREVSLGQLNVGGFWDIQFPNRPMYFSQQAGFVFKDFYQSARSREDYQLNYSANLVWRLASSLELKFQYYGLLNVSSVPIEYQYSAHRLSVVLSAYF